MLQSREERVLNTLISAVAKRQELLANNLTNVSTKGAVRQDIDFGAVMTDLDRHNDKGIKRIVDNAVITDEGVKPSYEKELSEMGRIDVGGGPTITLNLQRLWIISRSLRNNPSSQDLCETDRIE